MKGVNFFRVETLCGKFKEQKFYVFNSHLYLIKINRIHLNFALVKKCEFSCINDPTLPLLMQNVFSGSASFQNELSEIV